MHSFFVMRKTDPGHTTAVANCVADAPSCSERFSITGQYGLLAGLPFDDTDRIGRAIEREILSTPHSREPFTILTFEAFGVR